MGYYLGLSFKFLQQLSHCHHFPTILGIVNVRPWGVAALVASVTVCFVVFITAVWLEVYGTSWYCFLQRSCTTCFAGNLFGIIGWLDLGGPAFGLWLAFLIQ
jgi:hypothetical protein